ncbi:MAG: valine--tRNA ligase [Clostridiales bacterium]|nr:valine--tRNA ligase [Clostridiales bacterium]
MYKQLEKNYNPSVVEDRIYSEWLEKKYFHAEPDSKKEPFTIVIPPPNITGQLHMGHALDNAMQDMIIRFRRMQGYNALWIPGTDHASISTEVKIVNQMAEEGLTKEDIGREEFLKRAWAWKDEYGSRIINQLKKLGSSCDWDRERFTMDEGLSNAVTEVFLRLYKKGYIYKGEKLINWCPTCQTTISDAEVNHEDKHGHFWHLKYPIKGTDRFLEFATTRPETLLGDTAIAVNPDDPRYTDVVGKTCIVPFVDREIPVIADPYVDMTFGTGVVKITPAHDPNDFEVGQRHNLPKINILNDDGTINENGGKFKGMDRYAAREQIVEELKEMGLYIKTEDITHAVGCHDRCGDVIEPLIKSQWFVKMEELAKPAIEVLNDHRLEFIPERFGKTYLHWLNNIHDWCISRQLWWGHRIPAYYCDKCGHINVAKTAPEKCEKCGNTHLTQDEDTLDTWFSSALWPFSTLGWPEETEELKYFYPTSVLVTGYDIIFFWVIRMVFSGMEQMKDVPFRKVLIHGLVRDNLGRKMSKSLGNGVDPLEVIKEVGADVLRLTLITGNAPGNDMRWREEKVSANRNFTNKLWNATRFILMNFKDDEEPKCSLSDLTDADKWILSKANTLVKNVTDNLEAYELGVAVQNTYDFVWDEFCDWYIEMVKPRLYNENDPTRDAALWTLKKVLITSLKLLHPCMPFITEEIFQSVQSEEESIMISKWEEYKEEYNFPKEEKAIELIKTAVKSIRNRRAEMNVAPSKKVEVFVGSENPEVREIFENGKVFFDSLASASEVVIEENAADKGRDFVSLVIPGALISIPFAELIDIEKETQRLKKEVEKLQKEVERVEKKLSNPGFVGKAPEKVINEEKAKGEKYAKMLAAVKEQLESLQA